MIELSTTARAKLNLTLDVIGKRPDGYHNLRMVMQEIELGDEIAVRLETDMPWSLTTDSGEIPNDEGNLAIKAARAFFKESGINPHGFSVSIQKQIPVCAGMGGGSADGAAILRLLYTHYKKPFPEKTLFLIAEQVGSDVPFALFGGTALAEEKGQLLRRLPPLSRCCILLCKPDFPVSTPELFRAVDRETISFRPDTEKMCMALQSGDINSVASQMYNVFEPIVSRNHPELYEIRKTMISSGALGVSMTGSGPTMFGIFPDTVNAQTAFHLLKSRYRDTFLTKPV